MTDGEAPHVALRLPVADWTRVAPPSGGSAVKPPPAPPEAQKGADGRVDVVEYLAKKGIRVSRLAGERFMMAGETVTIGAVLKAVNEHRDAAGLTPLSRVEVR